jgi:hypothetical protein
MSADETSLIGRHAGLPRQFERQETVAYKAAEVDVAAAHGLSLTPIAVRLLFGEPDSVRPHAFSLAAAHEKESLAVVGDPRFLVKAIAVDRVRQTLGLRPVLSCSRPLALLDPVDNEDIRRALDPFVPNVPKASEVDRVPVC